MSFKTTFLLNCSFTQMKFTVLRKIIFELVVTFANDIRVKIFFSSNNKF